MDKHAAFSHQAELLLKKKQEIELKKKADLQKKILDTKVIKEEPKNEPSRASKIIKSKAMFSRHKALLRSGLIDKNKSNSDNSQKVSSTTLSNTFDYSQYDSGKSSVKEKLPVKTTPNADSESSPSDENGSSAKWFQEALERAKEKAKAAVASQSGVSSSSSSSGTKRSRWGEMPSSTLGAVSTSLPPSVIPPPTPTRAPISLNVPSTVMGMVKDGEHLDAIKGVMLTQLTRQSPIIVSYALQVFGNIQHLTEDQWKQCEEQVKMNVVFQLLQAKQVSADRLAEQGKVKYEYDSDEDVDGGTWEHKRRKIEMEKTALKSQDLTEKGLGKHHIGDFLPPEEMQKFMEKFSAIREGRDPDFSDYKSNKLTEDNIGYRMLRSMGWTEGQGLGPKGVGITQPVNQNGRAANTGLGVDNPDTLTEEDTEYDAYRKRMMLSYRFRPNPLNNPRRPYY